MLFWLQGIGCFIPLRQVFTLQDRTSGDLDLDWLEALWKGYRGDCAAISGKLWLSGKMKPNIGCMGEGRGGGGLQVLSVKVRHQTSGDLGLVVGVYSGVPLRSR